MGLINRRNIFFFILAVALFFSFSLVISFSGPCTCNPGDTCPDDSQICETGGGGCTPTDNYIGSCVASGDDGDGDDSGSGSTGDEICNDLIDNDGDGAVDCGDADCASNPICVSSVCPSGMSLSKSALMDICGLEGNINHCTSSMDSDAERWEKSSSSSYWVTVQDQDDISDFCLAFYGKTYNKEGNEFADEKSFNYVSYYPYLVGDDNAVPEDLDSSIYSCADGESECTVYDLCSPTDDSYIYKFFIIGRGSGAIVFDNHDDTAVLRIKCPNNMNCTNDGTGNGARCEVCNNNGVCEAFEKKENCCDCRPCSDSCRKTEGLCEGTGVGAGSTTCKWCPTPSTPNVYPYAMPNQPISSDNHACVNIANDPLNCGGCGFIEDGTEHVYYTAADGGLCKADTPFCVNKVCVDKSNEYAATYAKSYRDTHPSANKWFSPYTISTNDKGGKKASIGGVTESYSISAVDTNAAACTLAGGTFTEGLGCCGDNKCRSSGPICQITKLCDGKDWHVASDAEASGEVFKSASCFNPFPMAQLNSELVKCVDDEYYYNYSKKIITLDTGGCRLEGLDVILGDDYFSDSNENESAEQSGAWAYSCPAGQYVTASVRGGGTNNGEGICTMHAAEDSAGLSGSLVCTGESSFGFVSILDTGTRGLSFKNDLSDYGYTDSDTDGSRAGMDAFCPAPIKTWKQYDDGRDVNPVNAGAEMIPCPGRKTISGSLSSGTAIALTASESQALALVCSPGRMIDGWIAGLYSPGYFRGDGSLMGSVSNHEYACFTQKPTTAKALNYTKESNAFIGICCGASINDCADIPGTINSAAGKKFKSGDYLNTSKGKVYCLANGTAGVWVSDLDNASRQDGCKRSGLLATGNYCCSEGDDNVVNVTSGYALSESYNDAGGSGGCFRSEKQPNAFFLRYNNTEYKNVYVNNGTLLGCTLNLSGVVSLILPSSSNTSNISINNTWMLNVSDWPNPGAGGNYTAGFKNNKNTPVIKKADSCMFINDTVKKGLFCSMDGVWQSSNGEVIKKSVVPPALFEFMKNRAADANLASANCCKMYECWDPAQNQCIPAHITPREGYQISNTSFFRCMNGAWIDILGGEKFTPDNCYSGFCSEQSQCLLNIAGSIADNGNPDGNPQCLNDNQFKGDYVCVNGVWDTRMRILALKMIELVGSGNNEFKLSCGKIDTELNAKQNPGASDTFCILSKGNARIIGTFLNQPIADPVLNKSFTEAVKQSFWLSYPNSGADFNPGGICTPASKDFQLCLYAKTATKDLLRLYYDSNSTIAVLSTTDLSQTIGQKICNALPSWLQWFCPAQPELKAQLSKMGAIEKLYAIKIGAREAFGYGRQACTAKYLITPAWHYYFNYSNGFSDSEQALIRSGVTADDIRINSTVLEITNPLKGDVWESLSALKHQ